MFSYTPKNPRTYIYQIFQPQISSTLLRNQKYSMFVTQSKNCCDLYTVNFLLLFIYLFFLHSYRVSHDPVVGLRRARGAAGGGRASRSSPPPAHDFILLLLSVCIQPRQLYILGCHLWKRPTLRELSWLCPSLLPSIAALVQRVLIQSFLSRSDRSQLAV